MQEGKWLSEEALQIAEERREVKGRGERERYTQLNAEFQRQQAEIRRQRNRTMQRNRGKQQNEKDQRPFQENWRLGDHIMQGWAQ